ncbi:Nitroreductase [Saccharopolyspora antimicrobica]|uniref:Nitroreductase n=1 Tax=Saccharopolyspora antimicrobica TaxID=455193 RepID=A0A1I4SCG8_9PSEU|nr:nitroreductase family protein [Saccharopolyspora antimicrobica]RKT87687.1 nitroreductase [Saccharopolyspora antimicrobica]SFM62172.1 Nitroreductase [Saccharopolyspora antimicrobica]
MTAPAPRPHAHPFVPYTPPRLPPAEGLRRGQELFEHLDGRRSVRFFSSDPVPREAIELAVRTANTAPSGAHQQPWTFVAVADPDLKHRIRLAAEAEERAFYGREDIPQWHGALSRLETDANKEFLDVVPWIVVAFAQKYRVTDTGKQKHYYVNESVGIACGMFITALHTMGLATLTHTPNPMGFLTKLLERPSSERPYILFPVGYPADDCEVPELTRKPLEEALLWR